MTLGERKGDQGQHLEEEKGKQQSLRVHSSESPRSYFSYMVK